MRRISILLILVVALGCSDTPEPQWEFDQSTFIFGQFYGFCLGESCIEIFSIDGGRLYEDTSDRYPAYDAPYVGTYRLLPDEKYQLVRDIPELVPSELISNHDTVIGQPDAGDWGGYYLEFHDRGRRRFWLMDKNELNLPEELKPFARLLGERIALIQ